MFNFYHLEMPDFTKPMQVFDLRLVIKSTADLSYVANITDNLTHLYIKGQIFTTSSQLS